MPVIDDLDAGGCEPGNGHATGHNVARPWPGNKPCLPAVFKHPLHVCALNPAMHTALCTLHASQRP
jgi:hypothetical protein